LTAIASTNFSYAILKEQANKRRFHKQEKQCSKFMRGWCKYMKKRLLSGILTLIALFTASVTIVFGGDGTPHYPIDPMSITLPPIVIDIEIDDEC